MLIMGLLLVVFSGCSNTDLLLIENNNIDDLNITNTTTYSSFKINNLTAYNGYTGNVTIVSSVTPLLFVTFQYENGILKAVN